jgi:hypothetical protein
MSARMIVLATELVRQTATRACGRAAYESLVKRILCSSERPLDVIVDLSAAEMITGSFLDELVLRTSELPLDTRIVFRLASENQSGILQQVCAVRNTSCRFQVGESGNLRHTRRRPVPRVEAEEYREAFFTA